MKTRNDILAMVRNKIRLKHYALSTEVTYVTWVGRYYDHCLGLNPNLNPETKAEDFLTYLAKERHLSARSQNQALAAILFLYKEVLNKPLGKVDALRARSYIHERTAPSRDQIMKLRAAMVDRPIIPARLLFDLLYGCGLRVSEPLELRIKDILWEENTLVIRCAKGAKDRRVPIPLCCIAPLRAQQEKALKVWEADRRDYPEVGVNLPNQLSRKYRTAPFSWQWFWLEVPLKMSSHRRR